MSTSLNQTTSSTADVKAAMAATRDNLIASMQGGASVELPKGEELAALLNKMKQPVNGPEAAERQVKNLDEAVARMRSQKQKVVDSVAADQAAIAELEAKEAALVAKIDALIAAKTEREERAKQVRANLTLAEEQIASFVGVTRAAARTALHSEAQHRKSVVTSALIKERGYSCAAEDKASSSGVRCTVSVSP